jgi:hypothetical protein
MATIFVLAGSVVGFWLGMVGLLLGANIAVAMMVWMAGGVIATLLYVAMTTMKPTQQAEALTQSA